MRPPAALVDRHRSRGQALVETAIILPILLILLVGAIDFGRAFFGWVNLHQAVRIGANYAATNPNMTVAERARFEELIAHDLSGILSSCQPESLATVNATYTTSGGIPTVTPTLGDYAHLTLQCDFTPITPLIGGLIGNPLQMSATSTFPIREGCINCPTPAPPPPAPVPVQCFDVPDMVGMSVGGARLAWESAGFDLAKFTPGSGQDTETVDAVSVVQDNPLSTCVLPDHAIFSSSVTVTTETPDTCAPGSDVVPNVVGVSLDDARAAWAPPFDPTLFTADGADPTLVDGARIVESQTTVPPSTPGVTCLDLLSTEIDVVTGDPWPAPPPVPCLVPNMINLTRAEGQAAWSAAGFSVANYSPTNGGFTIRSQSLVGGTYVNCGASISVAASP